MNTYDDITQIGEVLYQKGLLDDSGLVRLQDAELYIKDRLAQERARQVKQSVPHAHQTTAIEIIAGMKLPGPNGPLEEHQIVKALAETMGYSFMRLQALDMDPDFVTRHLPQKFADRFLVIPVRDLNGKLQVAVFDPSQREVLEDVSRVSGKELDVVIAPKSDIMKIILEFHGFRGSIKAAAEKHVKYFAELADLERLAEVKSLEEISHTDKNIRTAVDAMFRRAMSLRASDVHVEPKRGKSLLRMRIDGMLHDVDWIPGPLHGAFTSRIKAMANMDIAEKRRPQDGRIKLGLQKRDTEVRVSTVPTAFGEKTVCRIQDPDLLFMDLEELGFNPLDLTTFQSFINRPFGIVLVTGPTGSGKTTTLYSGLKVLATPDRNITCIEDPIEMVFDSFNQMAVSPAVSMLHNPEEKMTFGPLLRHVMRQDPDVIMIGEIRDEETATLAVQAALTGHLVFSTLHTNDALTAINRMLDLHVPSFLLAGTVVGLIAQRLMRKVCPYCAEEYLSHSRTLTRQDSTLRARKRFCSRKVVAAINAERPAISKEKAYMKS